MFIIDLMLEEANNLGLSKPPAIGLSRVECLACESEEDSPLFLAKSRISLSSTLDSPFLMGRSCPVGVDPS